MFTSFHISHFHVCWSVVTRGCVFSAVLSNLRQKTTTEADFLYKEREKNLWLPLARSAGVLWTGESCFMLLQIAVVGIFDLWQKKLGIEEIATLRVGARAIEGEPPPSLRLLTFPFSSSLLKFRQGTFASKNIREFDENACTAGKVTLVFNLTFMQAIGIGSDPRALIGWYFYKHANQFDWFF